MRLFGPILRSLLIGNPHSPGKVTLATPPGATSPTLFEQWCGFFYVPHEPQVQISESAVSLDLRLFVLI